MFPGFVTNSIQDLISRLCTSEWGLEIPCSAFTLKLGFAYWHYLGQPWRKSYRPITLTSIHLESDIQFTAIRFRVSAENHHVSQYPETPRGAVPAWARLWGSGSGRGGPSAEHPESVPSSFLGCGKKMSSYELLASRRAKMEWQKCRRLRRFLQQNTVGGK